MTLILAFAGVKPLSSYKEQFVSRWETFWTEQTAKIEESVAQAKIEAKKMAAAQEADLTLNYAQIFNEYRHKNGRLPLTFDSRLNELAKQRAVEIAQPGNFNHDGIKKYNLGENIAMMAYSTDSNDQLLELWAHSPGHRNNMLSWIYSRTGFARVGKHAVQVFD